MGRNSNHPTQECLNRLHSANVKTYWTELGGEAKPDPAWDKVSGDILVEVEPGKAEFKVFENDHRVDTYPLWQ